MGMTLPGIALPPEGGPGGGGDPFLDRVEEWRRALGLSHEAFARRLGITGQYWWLLRTGRRGLSLGVARRVLRERPELAHFLAAALLERPGKRTPKD